MKFQNQRKHTFCGSCLYCQVALEKDDALLPRVRGSVSLRFSQSLGRPYSGQFPVTGSLPEWRFEPVSPTCVLCWRRATLRVSPSSGVGHSGKKLQAGRGRGGRAHGRGLAALQVLPGGAGGAHVPGPGAGPPGVADAAAAAERGAVRPARAAPAPGGRPAPRPRRAPGLAAARRALPEPAAGGREAGEAPARQRGEGAGLSPLPVPGAGRGFHRSSLKLEANPSGSPRVAVADETDQT